MSYFAGNYDIAVIGAGHAGIEAALAAARLGLETIVFTINLDAVGNMPCNPAIGGTGTSAPKRKTAVEHQKPLEVCERLAPKAAAAYTSKGEDRDRLVKRYFTADAQGLNIPTDRIAEQPDVQASGGMNAGTDTTATCSVWTGLESPWTLTYQWTADKGWKCTGISGPLEGAYTTLGDKTPDEKGEGEE